MGNRSKLSRITAFALSTILTLQILAPSILPVYAESHLTNDPGNTGVAQSGTNSVLGDDSYKFHLKNQGYRITMFSKEGKQVTPSVDIVFSEPVQSTTKIIAITRGHQARWFVLW